MKSANKTAIKWIGRMIRPYSGPIALLALISASISICIVSFAFIARWLIDCAVGDREGTLLAPGAALIALLVVRIILNASQTHLHQWLIGKMDMRIKQHMFSELMKKEWNHFRNFYRKMLRPLEDMRKLNYRMDTVVWTKLVQCFLFARI